MGASCQCERQPGCKVVITAAAAAPIQACASASMAEKDSKGMVNHKLLVACRDDDVIGIQKAIQEGAYFETRRPFVMRPKPPTTVGALMEGSGKQRRAPREGLTPLMYAAQNGSASAAKLLIEARAQVTARDEDGMRPLHFAAAAGSIEVCSLLLRGGAEKEQADDEGRRPIDYVPEGSRVMRVEREQWEALLGTGGAPALPDANRSAADT
mmetsp:Transcript_21915/g.46576  ORF Transcript_21915/g.46576 Transcript_21915/m.46576 type:complete len:211 (-) Transcript_21915:124-756(-)